MSKTTYKISPSTLKIFSECKTCFWLHFNGEKRPAGIFPSLPSGMDKVLKTYFDTFIKKKKLPPVISELKGVKLFDDEELLKVWRSNFKGLQWADKEGNILRGAVDNVLKKGKNLIVLDYKTRGFPLKEDTAGFYQDQMNIYTYLLQKNGYSTEDYAYLVFYYPNKVHKDGSVDFHAELVKMKVSTSKALSLFKDALKTLQGKEPKPNKDCDWCNWKK